MNFIAINLRVQYTHMLGNKYAFKEHTKCSICYGKVQRPKCPGLCGIFNQSLPWFDISGNGTNLDQSSSALLNVVSGQKNIMNQNRSIPYFCCQYILCLSCNQAEIQLHNKYKIVSPFSGCGNEYTVTNNGAQIGKINKAGCCCCKYFQIFNQNGDLIQTVGKSDGLLDNIIGKDLIGVNTEGVKISEYNIDNPLCCGGIEVTVEILSDNEKEKCLNLALIPYF